jgi:hypothetical protein
MGVDKRVGVVMSAAYYRILKQYAARFDATMSEVLFASAKKAIHEHSAECDSIESLLASERIPADIRSFKPCWSYLCMTCARRTDCRVGAYDGTWVHDDERFGAWEANHSKPKPQFHADILEHLEHAFDVTEIADRIAGGSYAAAFECYRLQKTIPFCEMTVNSGLVFVSDALAQAWGISCKDPQVDRMAALVNPERQPDGTLSTDCVKAEFERLLANGSTEYPWTHCDIESREYSLSSTIRMVRLGDQVFAFLVDPQRYE